MIIRQKTATCKFLNQQERIIGTSSSQQGADSTLFASIFAVS